MREPGLGLAEECVSTFLKSLLYFTLNISFHRVWLGHKRGRARPETLPAPDESTSERVDASFESVLPQCIIGERVGVAVEEFVIMPTGDRRISGRVGDFQPQSIIHHAPGVIHT